MLVLTVAVHGTVEFAGAQHRRRLDAREHVALQRVRALQDTLRRSNAPLPHTKACPTSPLGLRARYSGASFGDTLMHRMGCDGGLPRFKQRLQVGEDARPTAGHGRVVNLVSIPLSQ